MNETKSGEVFFTQSQIYGDVDGGDTDEFSPNWVDQLSKAINGGAQCVFARDISLKHNKMFTSDLTHEQMIRYQQTQPRMDRNFYEVLLDDKLIKLFYDIDIAPAIENMALLDQLVNEVINVTIISMQELYNIDNLTAKDFAVLDASGEVRTPTGITTKTSIHIVLVNKVRFRSILHLKDYVTFIFSNAAGYIKDKIDLHIDHGVYRRKGSLRIPGSTKRGQNRHLVIVTDHTELECLLTFTDGENEDDIHILEKPTRRNNKRKEDHIMRIMQSEISAQQITNEDIFQRVIDALPSSLAADYNTWINTGIKLYTAGANETYWIEFSKKCMTSFDPVKAHEKWTSFKGYGNGNMAGLFRLLKDHNLNDVANELCSHTLRFMGKFNNEIAMGLARLYGDNHVFSRGNWYYFNGSKWIIDENQTFISRTIMTTFHDRLNEEIRSVSQFLGNISTDHPRYNKENARIKNLTGIKEKTQSGRINSDWHALNVAFDQPTFEATLDSFQNLIAFENGVYDLELDQFVEPQREHRTTMSTKYDYIHTYDIPQKDFDELDELLRQIFPDEHILHYMMRFLGSCLSGYVNEELIHFWTGLSNKQTGSNGKSTFVSLLLLALGDYASCGHSSIITSRRENSNSTNSALMSLKGKRLVTFQEIDNENAINMPVIKSLTGNDQITGRQLYKVQETFTPQWKLVVCANRLPPVSSDDGGTQRRLRNIPFESKFVENIADPKWNGMTNIFAVDYTLKSKLQRYKMPLMHRLIYGYNTYIRMGLEPCHKIISHTSHYFQQHNVIFQFMKNNITESFGTHILLREIVHHVNGLSAKQAVYSEEDIVETCRDSFPNIVIAPLAENDLRLVVLNHKRIDNF